MAPHAESPTFTTSTHDVGLEMPSAYSMEKMSHSRELKNNRANVSSMLQHTPSDETHDLVCIGFGPAAVAIAVALQDSLEFGQLAQSPRVCFLERQRQFAWHAGMQIPGATMQISWIKDLATIRNPRSHFTFLNYLHSKKRLLPFSNLGTFLPKRREYEDYMRWCAEAFEDVVSYGQEALEIIPERSRPDSGMIDFFTVKTRNLQTRELEVRRARHVVVAGGGKPSIPSNLPQHHPRVVHSAAYMHRVPSLLQDPSRPYRVAVIGAGQSAAETFNDLQSRYPHSQTRLIIRGPALKPSDDSPFINEVFDPNRTDSVYNSAPDIRAQDIQRVKDTNYSVVRLSLLEHIYENLYEQRLDHEKEEDWPHQILNFRETLTVETPDRDEAPLLLHLLNNTSEHDGTGESFKETLSVDAVVVATGYERSLHDQLLTNSHALKPQTKADSSSSWEVSRDYRIKFADGAIAPDAGVWLQGCCENTHGLSDTLLSVLATRAGEVVDSIFGPETTTSKPKNMLSAGAGTLEDANGYQYPSSLTKEAHSNGNPLKGVSTNGHA